MPQTEKRRSVEALLRYFHSPSIAGNPHALRAPAVDLKETNSAATFA